MAIIVSATVARAWPIMRTSFPHVVDACKYMLYLGACACNAPVAPLLPLSQWFARLPFALDMLSVTHHPEHLAAIAAGVAPVSEHVHTCVVPAEHFIKVRAVVLVGGAGHHLADEFVARVHADAELVAVVALAVLFCVGGVQVFLSAFGCASVGWDAALFELHHVFFCEVLDGSIHQCGVNDLAAAGQVAMAVQLVIYPLKEGCGPLLAKALLELPQGVAVRYVG